MVGSGRDCQSMRQLVTLHIQSGGRDKNARSQLIVSRFTPGPPNTLDGVTHILSNFSRNSLIDTPRDVFACWVLI